MWQHVNYLSRSVPEIHYHVAGALSNQQTNCGSETDRQIERETGTKTERQSDRDRERTKERKNTEKDRDSERDGSEEMAERTASGFSTGLMKTLKGQYHIQPVSYSPSTMTIVISL